MEVYSLSEREINISEGDLFLQEFIDCELYHEERIAFFSYEQHFVMFVYCNDMFASQKGVEFICSVLERLKITLCGGIAMWQRV